VGFAENRKGKALSGVGELLRRDLGGAFARQSRFLPWRAVSGSVRQ
jgi:hypothetical protein